MRGWDIDFDSVVKSESGGSAMLVESLCCCCCDEGFVGSGHGVKSLHGEA